MTAACELCATDGGEVVWRGPDWRVVRVADADCPGFYRVIWNAHVAEWTDLSPANRQRCIEAVAAVERAMRDVLSPDKVNLASLGNAVPHLHWHVIGRFRWDARFPQPVWGAVQRTADAGALAGVHAALPAADAAVRQALDELADTQRL